MFSGKEVIDRGNSKGLKKEEMKGRLFVKVWYIWYRWRCFFIMFVRGVFEVFFD